MTWLGASYLWQLAGNLPELLKPAPQSLDPGQQLGLSNL
jgi:hypothetical protein